MAVAHRLTRLTETLLSGEPLRLHTPAVEYGGLGGHVYAPKFVQRLEASVAYREAVEDGDGAWWQSAEVRRRVQAAMLTQRHGGEAYALLALHAMGRISWERAVEEFGGNEPGLLRMSTFLHAAARDAKTHKRQRHLR